MAGYTRMIVGGALTGVFIVSLIIFMTQFAIDNDSDISLAEDSRYNNLQVGIKSNITKLSGESKTSQEILFKSTLESGDEHSSTGAQFKIGPLTAMSIAISSFNTGFFIIFGKEFSFIAITFVTMITFIIGYFTIKAWLGRSPE